MSKSHLLIEEYAGITVATFTQSSILDTREIDQLGQQLFKLTDEQNRDKLVLDFSNVRALSSQAVGMILNLKKRSEAIKGSLLLCGIRKEVMKLFTITALDKLFKLYKDDAAALESFGVHVK